ncbi:MAG: DUF3309 domain-containing protein [Nitrospira sp.]|nr:DUF3309 domain-containing protein [Nitrospira sp.]
MNRMLIVGMGLLLLFVLPLWPYSVSWGYLPSGALGFLLLVLTIQTLFGRLGQSPAGKP